jgi:hypothetical protein
MNNFSECSFLTMNILLLSNRGVVYPHPFFVKTIQSSNIQYETKWVLTTTARPKKFEL